jgi:hypothetical protein
LSYEERKPDLGTSLNGSTRSGHHHLDSRIDAYVSDLNHILLGLQFRGFHQN